MSRSPRGNHDKGPKRKMFTRKGGFKAKGLRGIWEKRQQAYLESLYLRFALNNPSAIVNSLQSMRACLLLPLYYTFCTCLMGT